MKEINNVRCALLDIKISNKGKVIKTVWYWCRKQSLEEQNSGWWLGGGRRQGEKGYDWRDTYTRTFHFLSWVVCMSVQAIL